MTKKSKATIGALGSAIIAGTIWLFQGGKPLPQSKWPECAGSINYPDRLVPTKAADGKWYATLKVKPPNAPCWIEYRAKATDNKGAVGWSAPVRYYITN